MRTTTRTDVATRYKARKGVVDIIDVPESGYLVIDGEGARGSAAFTTAVDLLCVVSHAVHRAVREQRGDTPAVLPVEAQWWVDDEPDQVRWRWRAMLAQPEPIDGGTVERLLATVRAGTHRFDGIAYQRWTGGRCAQTLHIGPYTDQPPPLARLHRGIATAGYRPYGPRHEIYLDDPWRSGFGQVRTILRQRVTPEPR